MNKKLLVILCSLLFLCPSVYYPQIVCPGVNAQFGTGPSTTICNGNCATLSASVIPVNGTTTYSVQSRPYSTFAYAGGSTAISGFDDQWSTVINIGFNFCYFGNTYSQCVVGSNGQITFGTGNAGGYNNWSIGNALPNTIDMPGNTICGVFRDIDATSTGFAKYYTTGTAPCRALVVYWNNVPLFSCNTPHSYTQIVLYESTNYIDVNIQNSSVCAGWNGGYGIVGIQNAAGTVGYAPAGRNYPSAWTAINESWRFVPTGAPSYTVNWAGPTGPVGTGTSVNVCPSATSNYTATMTTGACSGASTFTSAVQVIVTPGPTLAVNSATVCQGSAATLTVSGATSYTWTPGGSNATSVTFTPGVTTTYTVQGKNGSCISTATTAITVNPLPVATPTNNSPLCSGATLNLGVGAAASYTWTGPNSFSSNAQNPTIPGVTTAAAGVYTVIVKTAAGCTSTATTNVTVFAQPTALASNNSPVCAGSNFTLTGGTGGTSYSWTGPNAFSSTLQNPVVTNASTLASGTYSLLVTVGTCTASATTQVTVNPLPTPVAGNTGPYCPGNTIQLNCSAASSYTWSGPGGFTSNLQNPTIASALTSMSGNYIVTVTNANGCTASATTNVVVNPTPVPLIGSNSPVCLNNNLNLTSGGGTSYAWSGPNAFSSTLQNPTIASATPVNAGVYTVTVTALGCSATNTVNVVVTTPTTSASNTGPYCAGATIQLNNPGATSYTWSGPAAFSSNAQNPTRPGSTVGMSGTYTVLVSIGTCTATATTSVTVNPLPTPVAGNTGPYCPGNTIQLNGSAATSYTWSGPASFNSNSQNPNIASCTTANGGVYTFSVSDANGCTASATTNVVVNPTPVPLIGSNSPVCLNNNLNLTSGGGTSYAWSGPNAFSSTLQNPTITSATPVNAGVYTVTVTALGCSATNTVNVVVTTPTTSASNTGPYCAGVTIQLNNPGATSYTWSGPGAFSSNAQNPTRPASTVGMSGTYTVLVSIGTCTATATTSVIVNALPTPTAQSNSPVCVNQPINFLGSAATSYTWSGPASFNSNLQNPTIATAGTVNAGVYSYTVTDANGCKNSTTTNVVVNPLPVIVLNSPTVCLNQAINLTASGGAGYLWLGPNSFTSTAQNPTIPAASMANDGQYTVVVMSAAGCTNVAITNVSVKPLPSPAITSNTPCVGSTLNLQGSGATTYTWSGPNLFSSTLQNPTITNVTMAANGVYTLLGASGNCTASVTASITINPLPVPNIVTNSPICVGNPIHFGGTGGVNYSWSGPSGFSSSSASTSIGSAAMSNGGNYTLTVTDANGCVNSVTQAVVINALPPATATGTVSCQNSSTSLSAGGGVSYSWTGPGGFSSNAQNPTIANAQMSNAGQYTVVVTGANSCSNTAVASLTITPAPVPNIATNAPICINNILSFGGSGGVSYSWTGPNGFFSSAQNPTVMANSTAFTGTYNLVVTDAKGCSATASAGATVNPIPTIAVIASNNIGCAPLCVTYTVSSTSPLQTYAWNLGDGTTVSTPSAIACFGKTGSYTTKVSVSDVNGCSNSTTHTVQIYPQPVADFNYSPIKPIEGVDVVEFTDASYNGTITSWSWYFMNTAQYTSVQQNPTFLYNDAGQYAVALVVKNSQGCSDTVVKSILVGEDFGVWVPNAFTPNGDGLNDLFYAKGFGVTKFSMDVFDRWGSKVFSSTDINDAWDGTFRNSGDNTVQEGSYTWIIRVTSVFGKSKEVTGHVTLIK